MQRKPELLILAGLLIAAMAFVLWYVVDRRAKMHASPPVLTARSAAPAPAPAAKPSATPVPTPSTPAPAPSSATTAAAQPVAPTPTAASAATTTPATTPTPATTAAAATPKPASSSTTAVSTPATPKSPSAEPVDLTKPDRQTVDFSSGKPVLKDSIEDKAAIDAAMKDITSAEKETTFEAPKKEPRK